jgi:glycine/D-amino acid oxidase-like deaminating enzyme
LRGFLYETKCGSKNGSELRVGRRAAVALVKEYPYWWDTVHTPNPESRIPESPRIPNPEPRIPRENPESQIPSRADILIVGAGYTGLSAARELARTGASVVVVDREHVGWGASSRNGGQVIAGLAVGAGTLIARYGEHRARELFETGRAAMAGLEALIDDERIACDYRRTGHIEAAWKPSHFAAFRHEQALLSTVFNHRVELVPRSGQRSELGSDRYHGLLVDEHSAALNPARYVDGLAAAARRAGGCIVTATEVVHLERRAREWVVTTNRGPIAARDVVVATNAYTGAVFADVQRRFVPVGSYIIATEPLGASQADALLPKRRVAFDSKHLLYYFSVTADRRLLFGGRAEFSQPTPETTRRAAKILQEAMTVVFPQLVSTRIEYAWGGAVAITRDRMPHAGRIGLLHYAGGYSGHGIAMATHLGAVVARRIAGTAVEHPLLDDRVPPIPFYRGRPWFLPLVGAYYQVKDWLQ